MASWTDQTLYVSIFAELDFGSGYVRVWSGLGDLSWDSKTWTGVGDLGGISAINETTAVQAVGLDLTLSGIPSSLISTALGEDYQGRSAQIWIALLDTSGAVNTTKGPYGYRMDVMELEEGAESASITVRAESRLIDLKRPRERRYTDQDQQQEYSGDVGLEFVASLQDKQLVWN